mmetsp:Transcript_6749/g.25236  ORF Transcript_6749/g.25236 Transcript_6749/m.25236 type:complete len:95 (+) Transcript_6749:141-425(+)
MSHTHFIPVKALLPSCAIHSEAFSFQKKTWSIDYADKLDMDNVTPKAWIPNSTTWSLRGSIGIAELEQEFCDQIDLNMHHFLQKKEGQRRGERS